MKFNLIAFMLFASSAALASTGIIAGVVEDPSGNPIVGAAVVIEGTPYGAMTSAHGEYVIPSLAPGEYTLTARMVGRTVSRREGVSVRSDGTSRVDFVLGEDVSGSTVITVTERRTQILRDVPATAYELNISEMRTMSAGRIVDMVAAQPGVVERDGELHVRGGRTGEVDYLLDGISLRSPMDNRFNFDIPMTAVSGATFMTGGLSIEHGNVLSGIVDLVGKEGGDRFQSTIIGRTGAATSGMLSTGERVFTESQDTDPCRTGLSSGEISLSGPEPLTGDLLPLLGVSIPGEASFSASGQFSTSGADRLDTRNNWSYNWLNDASGIAKVVYRPVPRTGFSASAIGSYREHGWNQWAWSNYHRLSFVEGHIYPPLSQDYAVPAMFSETGGVIFNASHLAGDRVGISLTAGTLLFQNWNRIHSEDGGWVGEGANPVFWMTQYSPPTLVEDTAGFYYNGLHRNVWHDSKARVNTANLSMDYTPNPRMRFKAGLSGSLYDLYQYDIYFMNPGVSFVSLWRANPRSAAAFFQASLRFTAGAIATAGLRADWFDANATAFSPEGGQPFDVEAKLHASPRFSFSVPFSERSLFFTTYGHYFQMPPMNCLYLETSYNIGSEMIIAGNPDLDPELTTLFEMGIRQELDHVSDLAISFYNKDITGLISTADHGEGVYYIFTNDDSHGSVQGLETAVSRNPGENLSGQVFYTLSRARGRYSSMLQRYNYSQQGVFFISKEDNYLDWDQTHQAGASVAFSTFQSQGPGFAGFHPLENSSVEVTWRYGSGTPYSLPAGSSELVEINNHRRPSTMQTDISLTRGFHFGRGSLNIMFSAFNLFNNNNISRIYDTTLFHTTGDPTGHAGNPRAWSPARHFLLSAVFSW